MKLRRYQRNLIIFGLLVLAVWAILHVQVIRGRPVIDAHIQFLELLSNDRAAAYASTSANYRADHNAGDLDKVLPRGDTPTGHERWRCSIGFGGGTVVETNGEGWYIGSQHNYVKEDGQWRFDGLGDYFVD